MRTVTYRVFCSPTPLPGNVILLTADEGVREAAKRHNLPSDMWKNLDKRLFNALKVLPSAAAKVGVCPSIYDQSAFTWGRAERSERAVDSCAAQIVHARLHGEAGRQDDAPHPLREARAEHLPRYEIPRRESGLLSAA